MTGRSASCRLRTPTANGSSGRTCAVPLGVQVLLRHDDGQPQRARRRHYGGDDVSHSPRGARAGRRLGRVVPHRGFRARHSHPRCRLLVCIWRRRSAADSSPTASPATSGSAFAGPTARSKSFVINSGCSSPRLFGRRSSLTLAQKVQTHAANVVASNRRAGPRGGRPRARCASSTSIDARPRAALDRKLLLQPVAAVMR